MAELRKRPYSDEVGYVSSRKNPLTNDYVVLYDGADAGFKIHNGRWIVFCVAHGAMGSDTSEKKGRDLMKTPTSWCEACRRIEDEKILNLPKTSVPKPVPFSLKSPEEQEKEMRFWARIVKGREDKIALYERMYGVRPDQFWD